MRKKTVSGRATAAGRDRPENLSAGFVHVSPKGGAGVRKLLPKRNAPQSKLRGHRQLDPAISRYALLGTTNQVHANMSRNSHTSTLDGRPSNAGSGGIDRQRSATLDRLR